MAVETIKGRIERGMALLDKRKPAWCKKIDLATLNLASSYRCVLGQVYGTKRSVTDCDGDDGYVIGTDRLKLFSVVRRVECGFSTYDSYTQLTAAWKRAIKAHCEDA